MRFRLLLYPFAVIYGIIVFIRNKLFDFKILSSAKFNVPVISVGNITAGGTGKTPHVEYLISILKNEFKIAVLSRGYKRKTKKFFIAKEDSTIQDVGDEPKQIKQKFPEIIVAVDTKRVNGINNILRHDNNIEAFILDDAFQHRWVKPGLSILLIDYNRPIFSDYLLPAGYLRECPREIKRADIILVTKCPENISLSSKTNFEKRLHITPNQQIFFTKISYGFPKPVFNNDFNTEIFKNSMSLFSVLLITGIANPNLLLEYLSNKFAELKHFKYSDHYNYSEIDIKKIMLKFKEFKNKKAIILTTEKDAVKFQYFKNNYEICNVPFFYMPIEIKFDNHEEINFNNKITDYVSTNKRNDIVYTEKR